MWKVSLLALTATLFAGLTAVQCLTDVDDINVPSWDKYLALFMKAQPVTGLCGDKCYVSIGGEHHVLEQGKYVIQKCKKLVCRVSGVQEENIVCSPIESCPNGKAPVRFPGKCCQQCETPNTPPDKFTPWGEWTECSRTCGGGRKARSRKCKVAPDGTYMECTGSLVEIKDCNQAACPVNCEWKWGEYSACSATCGGGTATRNIIITQPAKNGGKPCPIKNKSETKRCNEEPCSVDCKWKWGEYGECSVTCGGGTATRYAIITQPARHGGKPCPPNVQNRVADTKTCNPNPCPVDCKWRWGDYTACSVTCGGGTATRYGIITQRAQYGGKPCPRNIENRLPDTKNCNPNPCPIDCKWRWGEYSKCSVTCGGGTATRYGIINQRAQYGGKLCPSNIENRVPDTKNCNPNPCPIPCQWKRWSGWSTCSVTCGGGTVTRSRGKIPAQYGGAPCVGSGTESRDCNTKSCPVCKPGESYCKGSCIIDSDGDCITDRWDNCKFVKNPNQADDDGDRVGDMCDNCVYARNRDQKNTDKDKTGDACDEDDDNDGRVDTNDNCPKIANPGQEDRDNDGWGDACDKSMEEVMTQEKVTSPEEKSVAAQIMEKLLDMYYSSK